MGADAFFLAVLRGFTPEMNAVITKAAGIACSFADIAFILILLKTSHALKPPSTPPPRKRVRALWFFAALTPTLALPGSGEAFVIWQSLVIGIPYLLLAHTVVSEFPILLAHLREKIKPRQETGDPAKE